MIPATEIVRWESTTDPSRWGVEIAGIALWQRRLEAVFDRHVGEMTIARPAFVLAALGSACPNEIAVAVSHASDFCFGTRVCVTLDQATLSSIDTASLRDKDVGIVLDQVGSNTPLSALCLELVEAVRFEDGFVLRASADARLACVLDAMLRLSHDLGMATLATVSLGAHSDIGFDFDYVSTPAAKNLSAVLNGERIHQREDRTGRLTR